jgi:hypothetical protein
LKMKVLITHINTVTHYIGEKLYQRLELERNEA